MTVGGVFREAWRLYRVLFWRSLLIAFPIFLVLVIPGAILDVQEDTSWTVITASVLVALFTSYGDLLVEGFMAEDVRDVYEDRPLPSMRELAGRLRPLLLPLAGGTLVSSVAFVVGLLLLIVPGLIIITRWSLIVPVIVLERTGVRDAFTRSSRLVKGSSWKVFWIVLILFIGSALVETLFDNLLFWLPELYASWLGHLIASVLTAPYVAHALAVIYFRLVDSEQGRSS